jgi:hypothetical protein
MCNMSNMSIREKLEDTEYALYLLPAHGSIILCNRGNARYELWRRSDGNAGCIIICAGVDYEFVLSSSDLSDLVNDTN